MMKYVVFLDPSNDRETLVIFEDHINHVDMAKVVSRVKLYDKRNEWYRGMKPISAGFVSMDFRCYGKSESLQLVSRLDEDTLLLRAQFK